MSFTTHNLYPISWSFKQILGKPHVWDPNDLIHLRVFFATSLTTSTRSHRGSPGHRGVVAVAGHLRELGQQLAQALPVALFGGDAAGGSKWVGSIWMDFELYRLDL